ncbi:MAG: hypothetical protein DPW18_13745 [Chloroflexi bacterium]|nr:MAG: hypothetical protein EDM79_16610 [Chloroflexota bacterium]MCQ3938093.1 hypothetical protein [Chloroflexota bacterium]MDL1944454.1 hypothetical protein [Chloroflexi bacterium CFX2]
MNRILSNFLLLIALIFGVCIALLLYTPMVNLLFGLFPFETDWTIAAFCAFVVTVYISFHGAKALGNDLVSIRDLRQINASIILRFIFKGFAASYMIFILIASANFMAMKLLGAVFGLGF